MRSRYSFLILLFILGSFAAGAQEQQPKTPVYGPNDTITVYATLLEDGTLVPTSVLPDAYCIGHMPRWLRQQKKQWTRLRNAVYVTYPYAVTASHVINDINASLVGVSYKQVRKKLIQLREKDLKKSFADKITNLSVYQGKVLMKLINRQTGSNCFEILEEYKGGANARFWQTVAYIFGSNLKQPYNARGEDAEMEKIVKEVELLYIGRT
jgi:hypothetical protein